LLGETGAEALRKRLKKKEIVVAPGVFSPSVAKLAENAGFEALYFSGAGFANLLALPDLGVTTLTEVARATHEITSRTDVPVIVDADTGFGEALNVVRAIDELRTAGASAVQIEDQIIPKKCGHLEGKELVDTDEMVKKVISANAAADGNPLIVARTDAVAVEGLDSAIARARAYQRAGADIIFPEALQTRDDFAEFRKKVETPLMANMTEFGKTPYMTASEFEDLGYNIVIFPVTAFRAMMRAVQKTFAELKGKGSQKGVLKTLMTREEFYDLVGYHEYEEADRNALEEAKRLRRAPT